jgi:xylulokinase
MGLLAGIDLGTSSTKVLIMDAAGRVLGVGNASYDVQIPLISYAEQDPEQWWTAVKTALARALSAADVPASRIEGISFSGQMHGCVALNQEMQPACPAIIHLDQRSGPLLGELRALAGDLMKDELLNQPGAGMMLSTLYWIKKEKPDLLEKFRFVLSPKDYIRGSI